MANEDGATVHHGQTGASGSLLSGEASLCSGYVTILSISVSDKSAFCKIQLSSYDTPPAHQEQVGAPSPTEGKALAHGAGLS